MVLEKNAGKSLEKQTWFEGRVPKNSDISRESCGSLRQIHASGASVKGTPFSWGHPYAFPSLVHPEFVQGLNLVFRFRLASVCFRHGGVPPLFDFSVRRHQRGNLATSTKRSRATRHWSLSIGLQVCLYKSKNANKKFPSVKMGIATYWEKNKKSKISTPPNLSLSVPKCPV